MSISHTDGSGITANVHTRRAAAATTIEKNRGRLEERALWVCDAAELAPYLAREWGWVEVQQVGWIRRRQKRRPGNAWQEQELTFVTSLRAERALPARLLQLLRDHWVIENKVHRVRDVSYHEDQGHGRKIGQPLVWARHLAMNLFRKQGFRYMPDGWRYSSAHLKRVVQWITHPA